MTGAIIWKFDQRNVLYMIGLNKFSSGKKDR